MAMQAIISCEDIGGEKRAAVDQIREEKDVTAVREVRAKDLSLAELSPAKINTSALSPF